MTDYAGFFLGSFRSTYQLECIELSHPSFSQTYRISPSIDTGITVKHNASSDAFFYEYLPATIEKSGLMGDLDQTINVTIGGLGEILPEEFERIFAGGFLTQKPTVSYRLYSSDDLNSPIHERLGLQVSGVAEKEGAATFTGEAQRLNSSKTGEIYSLDDEAFPDLRGAL